MLEGNCLRERQKNKTKEFLRMKLLESSSFEAVNSALFVETGEAKIVGRSVLRVSGCFLLHSRPVVFIHWASLTKKKKDLEIQMTF